MVRKRHTTRRRTSASVYLLAAGIGALIALAMLGGMIVMANDHHAAPRLQRQAPANDSRPLVSIDVVDNDYVAHDLTVRAGVTVTWRFMGDLPHTVTDEAGGFDSDVRSRDATFVHVFDTPGVYSYYCTLHHAMRGTLTVT